MKKRVLQFIGSFHQGGTERQAVSLIRSLVDDGQFEVFVATFTKDGFLLDDVESLGLPAIPEFRLNSFFDANFVRQVRRCAKYLKDNRIDLIHTHDFYTNVFGMAAATLAGISARIASKRETGGMRSRPQELIEKLAFGRAKAIVVNAEAVKRHLVERSVPALKIRVIHNGLDISRFDGAVPDAAKFGLPAGRRFVTLVANLRHSVKNVPMLLRVAKRVTGAVPDADIVIAGEGELETELRAAAAELGIAGRVHFIGRCTDVPALLATSFVCVLTSTAEGFSNSILEYMAAGKPVVATDVGGAAEAITEGQNGYLVASGDNAAMAERLTGLLLDPDKARQMGREGKRIAAESFSMKARLDHTIGLYSEFV